MNISPDPKHTKAQGVSFTADSLIVELEDGCTLSVPLAWFPRLLRATHAQRTTFELLGGGEGIHWPEIDEDISVQGLVLGIPSIERSRPAQAS